MGLTKRLKRILDVLAIIFDSPIGAGVGAFVIYSLFASQSGPVWRTTEQAYFNYLADAFLHGQISLRLEPMNLHDLVFYNGHFYLYWPPFPAILLLPFIAVFGVNFSDVLFNLVLAAINVGLVSYFLRLLSRRELVKTEPWQRSLLVVFFAFGTVHLILARWGLVWFTSQIVAFLCGLLVYIVVIRVHGTMAFFLAGLFLAFAMLTRNHLILLGIWPAYYLYDQHKQIGWNNLIRPYGIFVAPILIALASLAAYNWLRFGNVIEIGFSYQALGSFFQSDFEKYGTVSFHYVPINFFYNFIYYPFPLSGSSLMGGSLFLLSPCYLAAFGGFAASRYQISTRLLGLTILAVLAPILLIIGTGWVTFGPRYTLDFAPPLLMLTAMGIKRWTKLTLVILTTISIIQFTVGALMVNIYQ